MQYTRIREARAVEIVKSQIVTSPMQYAQMCGVRDKYTVYKKDTKKMELSQKAYNADYIKRIVFEYVCKNGEKFNMSVSPVFTEEHRQDVKWLIESTDDDKQKISLQVICDGFWTGLEETHCDKEAKEEEKTRDFAKQTPGETVSLASTEECENRRNPETL